MPDHDRFLKKLLESLSGQVFLAGRYASAELGLPEDGVLRVFLPDLHWMSQKAQLRFTRGYGFNGNSVILDGRPLFSAFLDLLEDLKKGAGVHRGAGLEVYQLGDCYDIWREITPGTMDIPAAYERIRNDPVIGSLATRLDGLDAKYVLGNHDHWLLIATSGRADRTRKEGAAAQGRIRLTHGHEYDALEVALPDEIQAEVVNRYPHPSISMHSIGLFSKKATAEMQTVLSLRARGGFSKTFYPHVEPDGAFKITDVADVEAIGAKSLTYLDVSQFSHVPGSRNDFDHISYLGFSDQILAAELNHPKDHCLHVIGHTHGARLLIDRLPDGRPHAVLDCGGWIGLCKVRTSEKGTAATVPSAQIGIQYGNDIRLYQLGGIS